MTNDAKPKQAWAVKMDELAEKYPLTLPDKRPNLSATNHFTVGYTTCRAEMQKEIDELKGVLDLDSDEYVKMVGNWRIINRLEEHEKRLEAELAKRDSAIEIMQSALKEINREELNSQRPGGGYSRSATISFEALAQIKKIMGEV